MINLLRGFLVAASFLTFATHLWAQPSALLPAQTYARAELALSQGRPEEAIDLANSLLRQNPTDFQALFLLSLGYSGLAKHDEAAHAATQAYHAALNSEQRLLAARIAGTEYFATAQLIRAEWWLRRAANNTITDDEAKLVRQEFETVREANPLTMRFGFSITPSNNINGGAEETTFSLGGLLFEFGPESLALSGIEYSGHADLTYRLSQAQNHITEAKIYLYEHTYSLSSSSQATVPNVTGDDYALAVAELSLQHRQLLFDRLGATGVSVNVGQIWYGGDPVWRYRGLSLSQDFSIDHNATALVQASIQDRVALNNIQSDSIVYDLLGIYAFRFDNQDSLQLMLGYNFNDAVNETDTNTDVSASIRYDLHRPVLGAGLSFEIGGGYKSFDVFSLSLDGRRDRYITAGATAVLESVSYFGFSPTFSLSTTRTMSNVSRYSTVELRSSFGIQSNF